jgi:excisionase family DNA binding protein
MSRANGARPKTSESLPDEVMSLAEAAAFLRVAQASVKQLAATGKLPGRQIGKEWRFLKSAIERWLATSPYLGPSDAQVGALASDPTFDDFMETLASYRRRKVLHRS